MNHKKFRENIQFLVDGGPNAKWVLPTRALVSKIKTRLRENSYGRLDIEEDISQIDMMLQGDNPDANFLEYLLKDLKAHLDFLVGMDTLLENLSLLEDD